MSLNYKDPDCPGSKIRPEVVCVSCHSFGCVTAWGPWCFQCNVERLDRINRNLKEISDYLECRNRDMLIDDEQKDSESIIHEGDIDSFCEKFGF
jgi:hypothetical protein